MNVKFVEEKQLNDKKIIYSSNVIHRLREEMLNAFPYET